MTLRAKAEAARDAWSKGWRTGAWEVGEYTEAASPDVVLALLDRVEALRIALRDSESCLHSGGLWQCNVCGKFRDDHDDSPDDHEPGCLVRGET